MSQLPIYVQYLNHCMPVVIHCVLPLFALSPFMAALAFCSLLFTSKVGFLQMYSITLIVFHVALPGLLILCRSKLNSRRMPIINRLLTSLQLNGSNPYSDLIIINANIGRFFYTQTLFLGNLLASVIDHTAKIKWLKLTFVLVK